MSDQEKKVVVKLEDIRKEAESEECTVKKALFYISQFLEEPMCGRCFPCSMGSYEARLILKRITEGKGAKEDAERLRMIAKHMSVASLCKKGKDSAAFLQAWLDTGDIDKHVGGHCPQKICCAFIEFRITPENCNLCGLCKKVCELDAISGEEKKAFLSGYLPYEIRQKKCARCGECIKVCPTGAISIVDKMSEEPVKV